MELLFVLPQILLKWSFFRNRTIETDLRQNRDIPDRNMPLASPHPTAKSDDCPQNCYDGLLTLMFTLTVWQE